MNMKRKLLSLVMAVSMMSTIGTTVFASNDTLYGGGEQKEYKTIEQQKNEFLSRDDKTDEEKEVASKHFEKLESMQNGTYGSTISTSRTYDYLYLDVFRQETGYYCGPATLKQTVNFLNGYSSSQSTIARAVGTTSNNGTELAKMKEYLNNNTSHPFADQWWFANKTSFINTIKESIGNDIPPILHMDTIYSGVGGNNGWLYSTRGHYMNICGYTSSGELVRVSDPYGFEGGGISSGRYFVNDDALYSGKNYLII